MLNRGKI